MKKATKLGRELKKFFPDADIRIDTDAVSIIQDTFYTVDRDKLIKLEKKHKAGLWCDARDGKVHYRFHDLGGWE